VRIGKNGDPDLKGTETRMSREDSMINRRQFISAAAAVSTGSLVLDAWAPAKALIALVAEHQ
jgi:hypothetical protein